MSPAKPKPKQVSRAARIEAEEGVAFLFGRGAKPKVDPIFRLIRDHEAACAAYEPKRMVTADMLPTNPHYRAAEAAESRASGAFSWATCPNLNSGASQFPFQSRRGHRKANRPCPRHGFIRKLSNVRNWQRMPIILCSGLSGKSRADCGSRSPRRKRARRNGGRHERRWHHGRRSRRALCRRARARGSGGMSFRARRARRPVKVWPPAHRRNL
jgi:hypothetical protein